MSDGTKSEYTKTGKKVKSIYAYRIDLTYNEVYDVFIDNKGDEFIIDDVGDKRYWSIYDDDYYELVYDNETKHKFKVGDKVKILSTNAVDGISNHGVKVGMIGEVVEADERGANVKHSNFKLGWWFTDKCIELIVDDTIENDNTTTDETKPKFKVGDKVKVVDVKQFSSWTHDVKVGYVGVVIEVDEGFYKVKLDKCYKGWWFTDKRIELVSDVANAVDTKPIENESSPIKSDGGSSSYYVQQIPKGMLERFNTTGTIEAKDVIRLFLGNDFNMGNIFKAYCRVISLRNGKGKAGIDEQYDLTKAKFFTEDELNYYLENKDV